MLHKGINQKWLVLFVLLKFKEGIYLEVKINREIRNYTESMFFGLSMRQFVFSVLACGVAVGLYFLLSPHVGTETVSWMCVLGGGSLCSVGVHPLPRDERRAVFVGVDQIGVPYPETPAFLPGKHLLRSSEAVH